MDNNGRIKISRQLELAEDELLENANDRSTKVNRVQWKVPVAEVDLKLAEKLDSVLKLDGPTRPKFLTNKTHNKESGDVDIKPENYHSQNAPVLTKRNLSKDEIRERVAKRYDTLVPELEPNRLKIRVVKVLSTRESVELAKDQARKQMERQMEMNSVSGNDSVQKNMLAMYRAREEAKKVKPTQAVETEPIQELPSILKLATLQNRGKPKWVKFVDDDDDDDKDIDQDDDDDVSSMDDSSLSGDCEEVD